MIETSELPVEIHASATLDKEHFDKETWIAAQISDRVKKHNKNAIVVFVGATGNGKSWSALRLAELINPGFSVVYVVFRAEDSLDLVRSPDVKPGSVIIWDETGLGMPAREWQSVFNKSIGYVLQSFRFKNLVLIMTVPDQSFIDAQARRLFHYYFEMVAVHREQEIAVAKPFLVDHSARFDKDYYKYPIVWFKTGPDRVGTISFEIPSVRLREAYERKRRDFLETYYNDLRASMDLGGSASDIPAWAWRLLLYDSQEAIIPIKEDGGKIAGFRPRTQAELAGVLQISRQWTNQLLGKAKAALHDRSG